MLHTLKESLLCGQDGAREAEGEGDEAGALRPLAVSLLCGMAHSTQRTRAELWAQNGLDLLLALLREQASPRTTRASPWGLEALMEHRPHARLSVKRPDV